MSTRCRSRTTFRPCVSDDGEWIIGRGSVDMKCGRRGSARARGRTRLADAGRHVGLLRQRRGRGATQRAWPDRPREARIARGRLRDSWRADVGRDRGRLQRHAPRRGHRSRQGGAQRACRGRASTRSTASRPFSPHSPCTNTRTSRSTGWSSGRASTPSGSPGASQATSSPTRALSRSTIASPRMDRRRGEGAGRAPHRPSPSTSSPAPAGQSVTWKYTDEAAAARPGLDAPMADCVRRCRRGDGCRLRRARSLAGRTWRALASWASLP